MNNLLGTFFTFSIIISISSCNYGNSDKKVYDVETIESGAKFCEGITENNNQIYFSNFGGESLNPLNLEGKGYIMMISDKKTKVVISANGELNAPKGIAIDDDILYIADVGCIVIYNLKDSVPKPVKLKLPEGNLFVNDIEIDDDIAYISVTNTGKVFKLDISNSEKLSENMLIEYAIVPGANGIIIEDNIMYVASYPADGVTTDKNTIYIIKDINHPKVEKLINKQGQYDGLALSGNKDRLYFTNWVNGEVGYVVLDNKEIVIMDINYDFTGPADMIYEDSKLYITDLPNSKVVSIDVE